MNLALFHALIRARNGTFLHQDMSRMRVLKSKELVERGATGWTLTGAGLDLVRKFDQEKEEAKQ